MNFSCRLLLMMVSAAGIMFLVGCSSISTTVNPEFDVSNYHSVSIDSRGSAQFIYQDIKELLFKEMDLGSLNKVNTSTKHDSYSKYSKSSKKANSFDISTKEPDIYAIITVDKGFALPPVLKNTYEPVFMQPKKATVELWDAMTKKQLLLCTFKQFWGGAGASDYCRETLVKELTRVLDELKAKGKTPASVPQPASDDTQ